MSDYGTMQLAKLSFNHSTGRTHSWRLLTFYSIKYFYKNKRALTEGRYEYCSRFEVALTRSVKVVQSQGLLYVVLNTLRLMLMLLPQLMLWILSGWRQGTNSPSRYCCSSRIEENPPVLLVIRGRHCCPYVEAVRAIATASGSLTTVLARYEYHY